MITVSSFISPLINSAYATEYIVTGNTGSHAIAVSLSNEEGNLLIMSTSTIAMKFQRLHFLISKRYTVRGLYTYPKNRINSGW